MHERVGGCDEPSLVFGLRQHNGDPSITVGRFRTGEQFRTQIRRAVVVGVQKHEYSTVRTAFVGCETNPFLDFARPNDQGSRHPNRLPHVDDVYVRRHGRRDPYDERANRLDFAVALDDGHNGCHRLRRLRGPGEQRTALPGREPWGSLAHAEKLADREVAAFDGGNTGIVQCADS